MLSLLVEALTITHLFRDFSTTTTTTIPKLNFDIIFPSKKKIGSKITKMNNSLDVFSRFIGQSGNLKLICYIFCSKLERFLCFN